MKFSKIGFLSCHILFVSFMGCGTLTAQTEFRETFDSTCSKKNSDLKERLIEVRSCSKDSDCSADNRILSCYFTPCYGHPVNKNAEIKELEEQLGEYEKTCVEPLMCACPPIEAEPVCVSGLCSYPTLK